MDWKKQVCGAFGALILSGYGLDNIRSCFGPTDEQKAAIALLEADSVEAVVDSLQNELLQATSSTPTPGISGISSIPFGGSLVLDDARIRAARSKMSEYAANAAQQAQMAKMATSVQATCDHTAAAKRSLDNALSEAKHITDLGGTP